MKRTFEKWISFFLLVAIFVTGVPVSVSAAVAGIVAETFQGTASAPLWEYTETEGGIALTKYNGTATDVYIPSVFEDKTVVALADSLFENNDALNSATLGAGILEIGARAFYDCDNLVCVLVSEELTTVGDMAFYGCDVFNSIILYEAAVDLGADIFAECPKVVIWCYTDSAAHSYAIDNNLTHKFMDSEAVPETVEQGGLEYYVLNGQAYVVGVLDATLTSFEIPAYIEGCPVTEIRANVFKGNTAVSSVALPNTLKIIGESAFENVTALTSITLPDSLTSIGLNAFRGCTSLQTVTIPAVSDLGINAFRGCTSLTSAVMKEGLSGLKQGTFRDCTNLKTVDLPESMPGEILDYTFANCSNLTDVVIPEGITAVGASAFYYCSSLTSIILPESVEEVGHSAMYGCFAMKEIVIRGNIKKVVYDSFPGFLESVIFEGKGQLSYVPTSTGTGHIVFLSQYLKTLIFTDEQQMIAAMQFRAGIQKLETLVLGNSIKTIAGGIFDQAYRLKSVIIPESVTSMAVNSFAPNTVLQVYEGSYAHQFAESNGLLYEIYDGTNAYEFTVIDGVTYYVSDTEAIAVGCDESVTEIALPATVAGKPLTRLINTFRECSKITYVEIPEGVTEISSYAFYGCTSLTEVVIPKGVKEIKEYTFYGCEALETMFLPDTVEKVDAYAFYECYALAEVSFSGALTEIGQYAFYACSLKTISLPDGLKTIGTDAFCYNEFSELVIPDTVTSIGEYAFAGCSSLVNLTVPGSVGVVALRTFSGCSSLTSVVILDGVTEVSGFNDCGRLLSVTLPDSVVTIGEYAFANSSLLRSINLPANLKTIKNSAFANCKMLGYYSDLVIPEGVETIGKYAFDGCSYMKNLKIPEGVTSIGTYAFRNCSALESVELPGSLVQLYNSGWFSGCKALKEVTIGEGVTTIYGGVFNGNSALTKAVIPKSVTTMYTDSFSPNTVLFVYENSYAHQFAEENGLLYFLYDGETEPTIEVIDGITYCVLDSEAIAIAYDGSVAEIVMPDTVGGKPVTELRNTFRNASALVSLTLPNSLKTIGAYAFENCELSTLTVPSSVETIEEYAFSNSSIVSIELNEGLKTIKEYAFYYCQSLQSIVLPEGLCELGENVFEDCHDLESVSVPGTLAKIPLHAFLDCTSLKTVDIAEGVTTIASQAFYNCKALVTLEFPMSATTIGQIYYCNALESVSLPGVVDFGGINTCNALKSVVLPETVTKLVKNAFFRCPALQSVVAPGVTVIGMSAFENCTSLVSVDAPNVESIGKYAFRECNRLKCADFPKLESIGGSAFYHCYALETVTFSDQLNQIGSDAFVGCSSLKSFVFPATLSSFGVNVFEGCTSLTAVEFTSDATELNAGLFKDCTSLESVILPDTLKVIHKYLFQNCSALRFIYIPESVESADVSSFSATTILIVHENSYAHTFAVDNNLLYFVLGATENPEISYGMSMEGVVTYDDGAAASGVTVELFYDDGTLKESVVTDANGAYAFTYAEVGRYTVRATDTDGNTAVTQASVKRINVFHVFLAGDTDLVLKKGWTVSGTLSENTGTVMLTDADGNVIATVETTDGTFVLEKIPNGTYILRAESASASTAKEITVFDGDVLDITLTFPTETASIAGSVEVEKRDKKHEKRGWVQVTLYNSEGIAIATCKSNADGSYFFPHLPLDEYTIVAETAEMREDKKHHFDRSHTLTGYAYVNVTEATAYTVDTIVLCEENDNRATISGKVTANGQTQTSEVILRNCFRHEVARMSTGSNGKYTFSNVKDGLYIVTAVTESDGMGFAVVLVRGGKVHGETDIRVFKNDRIKEREGNFKEHVPECKDKDEAKKYRDRIVEEKRFYDGLSEKEKRQCSKEYVERLNRYCEWIAEVDYSTNDDSVKVEKGGLIVSGDELEEESCVSFNLIVNKTNGYEASKDGVHNKEDHLYHDMKDKAGAHEIKQYYDISMTKIVDGEEIELESVYKNTNASGKFRITITIPEEYRGHKHYTLLHEHCGEVVTLTDLDDDPDTITVEVDKFSTFALAATDEVLVGEDLGTELNFAGASLTLQEDLTINYKVDETLFTIGGFETPYVVFVMNGVETVVTEYTVESGYYVFSFTGILPSQMNDKIEAMLCATKNGVQYQGAVKTYSVSTYCYNMLANYSENEELRTLLVDILNYGAATQVYTNYNTDALANANLTDVQKAWASADRAFASVENHKYEVILDSAVTWIGAGLSLSESIAVRFEFTAESTEGMLAEITCGDTTWAVSDFAKSADGNDMFLARINAAYMSEPIYVKLYHDGIIVSDTVCYSIESYAKTFEADEKLAELVKAMMKYGDSARNYVTE